MDDATPLKLVQGKLRERMNEYADSLANGDAKNYEEYRNLCGVIHGLALAEREILDLMHSMERNDD